MTQEELNKILDLHEKWLKHENGGICADLSYQDCRELDFSGRNLSRANLSCANLFGADLSCAHLSGADLSCAHLFGADLSCADLSSAHLSGANLSCANLFGADLDDKEKCRLGVILDKAIIGYKKAQGHIVKLCIPKGAIVFSINNGKCRTNKAKVLEISDELKEIASEYDKKFIYKIGKSYEIEYFNLQYNVECGKGIHFFKTREEAEEYEE